MPGPITGDDPLARLVELEHEIGHRRPRPGEPGLGPAPDVWPPAEGVPVEPRQGARRSGTRTNRTLKILVALALSLIVLALGLFGYLSWRVAQIDRVAVSQALAPVGDGGPVWLIVGSDSRQGIDPDRPDAGGLLGEVVTGERADTIILLRDVRGLGVQMLSLPRDLWFDPPGDNNATRINGAYNRGPEELIRLIGRELGVGVQRYAEVDLAGLDSIVDAVGGVTVEIPYPGFDDSIGLRIEESGGVHLDGATALAYVRTRKWTETIDGDDVYDGTGDLGRNQRQQTFLAALGAKLGSIRNPLALNSAVAGIAESVSVDDRAGLRDLYALAQMMQRATQADPLPVVPWVTGGGASVLLLGDGSDEVLAAYR